jgi:hypothetical protein
MTGRSYCRRPSRLGSQAVNDLLYFVRQADRPAYTANHCTPTGALKGRVYLDGRSVQAGAGVSAGPGGNTALTIADRTFELPAVTAGGDSVDAMHASTLRAGDRSFSVSTGSTLALGNGTLLGGDCNGDDPINFDAAMAYVLAVPPWPVSWFRAGVVQCPPHDPRGHHEPDDSRRMET